MWEVTCMPHHQQLSVLKWRDTVAILSPGVSRYCAALYPSVNDTYVGSYAAMYTSVKDII